MHKDITKEARQQLIKNLIQNGHIRTQSDLVGGLKKQGMSGVLQSTISRDLLELGVLKKNGAYFLSDDQTVSADWAELVRKRAHELRAAGPHMLLLKVDSGTASLICLEIDALAWPEIVGTIAGEDTILLTFENEKNQQKIYGRILKAMGHSRS